MDYSLLLGVHSKTQAEREHQHQPAGSPAGGGDEKRRAPQRSLYSTVMESIQGSSTCRNTLDHDDTLVPGLTLLRCRGSIQSCRGGLLCLCRMGGIPAVGGKGENLLLFIGIIDILQSYRSDVHTDLLESIPMKNWFLVNLHLEVAPPPLTVLSGPHGCLMC